ncbi:MAG: DNA adenine methylase [Boseongicola sp. SB0662_bin_57]|nr:DNA adenine methylase [Boseongicola sp. SB0662_bin_57]
MDPVDPVEPVAPWFGGKKNLASRIITRIEAIPHRCYAEPFAGMGGVFLRRRSRPKSEILNDINGEIVNLYRVLREHPDALEAEFALCLSSRDEWDRLLRVPPDTLTDIRRAARWAFLQRLSFGGKPAHLAVHGNFAPRRTGMSTMRTSKMTGLIRKAHDRLQGVHVERLDWHAFIPRYDSAGTLFYLDPPYPGHEADYGKGVFAPEDFARMAHMLSKLKGSFIMSVGDTPTIRELFAWANIEEVETLYTANAKAMKKVGELLISG